jgi:hypothetical protein
MERIALGFFFSDVGVAIVCRFPRWIVVCAWVSRVVMTRRQAVT